MYLTIKEATKALINKLHEEFEDDTGNIDITKAAATIYNNPTLYEENHGFRWQLKAVSNVVEYPQSGLYHHRIWEWAGLRLIKVFENLD